MSISAKRQFPAPTAVPADYRPEEGYGPVIVPVTYPELVLNGKTWYVAPNGNDANDGAALGTAWKTLQHAVDTIGCGDTVLVAPGTYAGIVVKPENSGQATGWKCIKALDPANKPVIDTFSSKNEARNSFVQLYGDGMTATAPAQYTRYWICENLITDNRQNDWLDLSKNRYGFDTVIAQYIVIRNCEAYGCYLTGIFSSMVDWYLVENNWSQGNREHGYYNSCGGDNFIFRGNVAKENMGCGFHLNGGWDLPKEEADRDGIHENGLYEYNICTGNGKTGGGSINMSGMRNGVVRNNLCYNEQAGGLTFYGGNAADTTRDTEIYNNTVLLAAGNERPCVTFDGNSLGHQCATHTEFVKPYKAEDRTGTPMNLYFYNNIFGTLGAETHLLNDTETEGPGNPALGSVPTGPRLAEPNVVFRGNLFTAPHNEDNFTDIPRAVTEILLKNNQFCADLTKIFADPTQMDFHLAPNSPARDIGVSIPAAHSPVDNDAKPRTNKNAGAFA